MAADAAPAEMITIPAARLAELEAIAARYIDIEELNATMKKRLLKFNHSNVERVRAYDKENPDKVRERVRRHRDLHRESYNARRRELRRLKKEAEAAAAAAPGASN